MSNTEFEYGIGDGDTTVKATNAALRAARASLDGDEVQLVVSLSGPGYDETEITETITANLGSVPIVGMTTAGEFTDAHVGEDTIVLGLITSDTLTAHTSVAQGLTEDLTGTAQRAVGKLPDPAEVDAPHVAGLTFHDGLAGVGEEITLVTRQLLGDVPLAGGSAGDNLNMEATRVYTEDDVVTDGLAIALLGAERPFGLGVSHGHEPISEPYEVTKSDGQTVLELDGEPAFEVWKREIASVSIEEYGVDPEALQPDTEQLTDVLTKFEFGLKTGDGGYKIRWPGLTASTDGPMEFACGVPEGVQVRVMHSPKREQIDSARKAVEWARESMDGHPIAGTLVFDCICHALILDDEFSEGVAEMSAATDTPLMGAEVYGEVSMAADASSGYHNTTTSVFVIPE